MNDAFISFPYVFHIKVQANLTLKLRNYRNSTETSHYFSFHSPEFYVSIDKDIREDNSLDEFTLPLMKV